MKKIIFYILGVILVLSGGIFFYQKIGSSKDTVSTLP